MQHKVVGQKSFNDLLNMQELEGQMYQLAKAINALQHRHIVRRDIANVLKDAW